MRAIRRASANPGSEKFAAHCGPFGSCTAVVSNSHACANIQTINGPLWFRDGQFGTVSTPAGRTLQAAGNLHRLRLATLRPRDLASILRTFNSLPPGAHCSCRQVACSGTGEATQAKSKHFAEHNIDAESNTHHGKCERDVSEQV